MKKYLKFYIDGKWVKPTKAKTMSVINPATEKAYAEISLGSTADVDRAVVAARKAFTSFRKTSVKERIELLQSVLGVYQRRSDEVAAAITEEMGAPTGLSRMYQAPLGTGHLATSLEALKNFQWERNHGNHIISHEPIGVAGLITPWNWPMNQIASKVGPALAAGCTMVLKPSEIAPIDAIIFAEILHEAGVPAGVFNLINGTGPTVGEAMSAHPDIDMMSFTGSTRGGVAVAIGSAPTVKRVTQELGGKSANIILDDDGFQSGVAIGIGQCMANSGQSCNAPTRMLVPKSRMKDAIAIGEALLENLVVGDPLAADTDLGPVVSKVQFNKIQDLIQVGMDEKTTLVAGGVGKPDGLKKGYYVKPTIFANVKNDMRIAQEEIFGPVLVMIGYKDEAEAIDIANDSAYGLAAYVNSAELSDAARVGRQLNAGQVVLNYQEGHLDAPFGGFKQSGNGREKGEWGMEEYLEIKAIIGANARAAE